MKQKTIGAITPYLIDDHLIISLDKSWIQLFNKIPEFVAILDKEGRLILQGPVILTYKKSLKKNSLSEHKILVI